MDGRKLLKSAEAEALGAELLDALQTEHKKAGSSEEETCIRMVQLAETWLERLGEYHCEDDLVCLHYYHAMLYKLFATLNHFTKNSPRFTAKRGAFLSHFKDLQAEVKDQMDRLTQKIAPILQVQQAS